MKLNQQIKNSLYTIGISLLFVACTSGPAEKPDLIEEGEVMTSTIADTCMCETLLEDSTGTFYKEEALFTGTCIYNYPETDLKYMVKSILAGKLHGPTTYYDKSGNILVEEIYENGTKKRSGSGAPLTCDCSELEQLTAPGEPLTRFLLDGIPYTGKCFESYKNADQVYMEVNYEKGLKDGFAIFYDRTGETMYMEKYENGELIKVIHDVQ